MSFSRGSRFESIKACAPPPGAYDPKLLTKVPTATLTKSDRFKHKDDNIPGPGAFSTPLANSTFSTSTKKATVASSSASIHSGSSTRRRLEPSIGACKSLKVNAVELNKELDQCHRQIEQMESQIETLRQELDTARSRMSLSGNRSDLDNDSAVLKDKVDAEKEVRALRNQLIEKERESEVLNTNLKSILDKYAALECSVIEMRENQSDRELDLQRELLARRESLDCARSRLADAEETNSTLMHAVEKQTESRKELMAEKDALALELEKVLEDKKKIEDELANVKHEANDEIHADQSIIDHLYGDKIENDLTIQELEAKLSEKELLLADNLSRVNDLKQRLAEKECALMQIELEKSVLDKTLTEKSDEISLKTEAIENILSEKAELEIQVQNLELLLIEKEQNLFSQDSKLFDLNSHLIDLHDELDRKNTALNTLKMELEQTDLESDERRAQISDLQSEIDILKGDLEEKDAFVSKMKLRLAELEFAVEAKTNELSDLKDSSETEMEKLVKERSEFEQAMHGKLSDFEKRVDALVSGKETLSRKLQESEDVNKDLEHAMRELKIERDQARVETEEEILCLRKDRGDLNEEVKSLSHRLKSLSSHNRNLEETVNSLKTKISSLCDEKLELTDALSQKDEIMENYIIENKGLVNDMNNLQGELEVIQVNNLEKDNKIEELLLQISRVSEQKSMHLDEVLHLKDQILILEKTVADLRVGNDELGNEVVVLKNKADDAAAEIADLTEALADMEKKYTAMKAEKDSIEKRYSEEKEKQAEMDERYNVFKMETGAMLAERDQWLREQQEEYEERIAMLEEQLCEAKQDDDMLQEVKMWQTKYEELLARVRPFQEQLDQFAIERQVLLRSAKHSSHEMEQLGRKYAEILGHQNQNQKIRHVVRLKEENLNLQKEVSRLAEVELKAKRTIKRLQEDLAHAQGKKRFDRNKAFEHEKENPQETPQKKESSKQNQARTPLSARKQEEAPSTPGNRI